MYLEIVTTTKANIVYQMRTFYYMESKSRIDGVALLILVYPFVNHCPPFLIWEMAQAQTQNH
jgi:hypothetical protein